MTEIQEGSKVARENCAKCDGDGYTETWNDDQSDVVITLCDECDER